MGNKLLRSYHLGYHSRETLREIEERLGIPRTVSIEAGIRRLAELNAGDRLPPRAPEHVDEPKVARLPAGLRMSERAVAILDELLADGVGWTYGDIVERGIIAFAEMLADAPGPPVEQSREKRGKTG